MKQWFTAVVAVAQLYISNDTAGRPVSLRTPWHHVTLRPHSKFTADVLGHYYMYIGTNLVVLSPNNTAAT